jgi:hypothetical protein
LHDVLGDVLVGHAAEREAEQAGEADLEQLAEGLIVAPHGTCGQRVIVHVPLLRLGGPAKSFGEGFCRAAPSKAREHGPAEHGSHG